MKTSNYILKAKGSSLVLVLVVTAAGMLLVSGVMSWINTSNDLTQRVNQFRTTTAAAGAATEKVLGVMAKDFQLGGNNLVSNNLPTYTAIVPDDGDLLGLGGTLDSVTGILLPPPEPEPVAADQWSSFEFSDGSGNQKKSAVGVVSPWAYTELTSQFQGLNAYCATYRLVSNARDNAHRHKTVSGVQQDVLVTSIPVFGFHVFYAPDLEIHPGSAMTLDGRIHANRMLYTRPGNRLTLQGDVTSSQKIVYDKHPQDTSVRPAGQVVWEGERENGVNTLLPALGTNRSLADFHSIIRVPPAGESRTSTFGKQRLYNKADLIIKVSNAGFSAHSGAYNSFATTIPWSQLGEKIEFLPGRKGIGSLKDDDDEGEDDKKDKGDDDDDDDWPRPGVTNIIDGVVNTNVVFYNARENKTVRAVEIDINQLLLKFDYLTSVLGRPVRTLYVDDTRSQIASSQAGVRIVLGHKLPSRGLTIVTPKPLYVLGAYNIPTNGAPSVPAALIGDAVTILSPSWKDANSALAIGSRIASSVTVNAAILSGIVPTRGGIYSGGLENLPRLLEDWTGKTLTLKGSLVALYESAVATAPWGGTGPGGTPVYRAPQRAWTFDTRFETEAGLPPSTPEVRTVFRQNWQTVAAKR